MRSSRRVSISASQLACSHARTLQLLTIMSSTIAYLTSRTNFLQVSPEIPVTKSRNQDKYDQPDVFEGRTWALPLMLWLNGLPGGSKQK